VGLGNRRFKLDGVAGYFNGRFGIFTLGDMLPRLFPAQRHERIKRHCSFLALALRKELDRCLKQAGQRLK
jgi:hypothetical protein